ncbi:hypothetical protein EON64_10185 [archaeon]|nr:MAG: hypothetical protein EON64_10185 [archaeon]
MKLARIDSAEEVKEVIDQEGGEGNKEMADEVVSSASESLSPMLPPPPPPLATLPSLWSVLTMTGVGVWVLGVVLWVCTPRGKGVWGEWTGEVFIALSFLVLLYMMQVNNTMVEIQQKRVREDGRGIARRASEGREVVTTEQLPAPDHVLRTPTPWSHYPLLITRSPLCLPTDITPSERAALLHPITLPDNAVVSIRNEFFEGKVKILFRHTKPEHFR